MLMAVKFIAAAPSDSALCVAPAAAVAVRHLCLIRIVYSIVTNSCELQQTAQTVVRGTAADLIASA
jgi:hypothetical protein